MFPECPVLDSSCSSHPDTLSVSSEPDDRAGPSSKRPRFDEAFEAKQVIVKMPNLLAELFCSYSRFFIMRALQHLKKNIYIYYICYIVCQWHFGGKGRWT